MQVLLIVLLLEVLANAYQFYGDPVADQTVRRWIGDMADQGQIFLLSIVAWAYISKYRQILKTAFFSFVVFVSFYSLIETCLPRLILISGHSDIDSIGNHPAMAYLLGDYYNYLYLIALLIFVNLSLFDRIEKVNGESLKKGAWLILKPPFGNNWLNYLPPILSLNIAVGGASIASDGVVFKFKQGFFVSEESAIVAHRQYKAIKLSPERAKLKINALSGKKWQIWRNCFTHIYLPLKF